MVRHSPPIPRRDWPSNARALKRNVIGERHTIDLVREGWSLARFGDGELKLCHGEDSLTEKWTPRVADELRDILKSARTNRRCLIGIPHTRGTRKKYWEEFLSTHQEHIPKGPRYASSFVSRADEAAAPFTGGYRMTVRSLWTKRDVVLVTGGGSLTVEQLKHARSVRVVAVPPRDAAQVVDDIQIPDADLIILCAGAAGTILANRLAHKEKWAIDLGYIGKFLCNASSAAPCRLRKLKS